MRRLTLMVLKKWRQGVPLLPCPGSGVPAGPLQPALNFAEQKPPARLLLQDVDYCSWHQDGRQHLHISASLSHGYEASLAEQYCCALEVPTPSWYRKGSDKGLAIILHPPEGNCIC